MAELIANGCFCVLAPWYRGGDDVPVISGGAVSHDGEEGHVSQICEGLAVGSVSWSIDLLSQSSEAIKLFAGASNVIATIPAGSGPGTFSGSASVSDVSSPNAKQAKILFVGGGSAQVDNFSLQQ